MQKGMFFFIAILKSKQSTHTGIPSLTCYKLDLQSTHVSSTNHPSHQETTTIFVQARLVLYWDDLVGGNKVKDGKNAKNYHNILK